MSVGTRKAALYVSSPLAAIVTPVACPTASPTLAGAPNSAGASPVTRTGFILDIRTAW